MQAALPRARRVLVRSTVAMRGCRALALGTLAALAALLGAGGAPAGAHLRAGVGGFALMDCHLDFPFGNEIPYHLQWDKDGETIFSWYSGDAAPKVAERWRGRVRLAAGAPAGDLPGAPAGATLGRAAVNVSAVRESDAGLYRCRVTFPNRTPPARNNGTFYHLDVDGGNLIATPPVNVTVLEGARAELECRPKQPEWEVQWLKDGAPLAALPELAARALRPPNGSLVLPAAASRDHGQYSCRVRAPGRADHSAAAFLDVQYKAKVVVAPRERHLAAGRPASLDCHFSANPPLTNLRWEKDGFLFDPYNVPGVFYSRNGSLLFNEVDESHEGEYSCTPYNALGSAGASARVRVRVQRPPSLAARPPPVALARLGQALTLPCQAAPPSADHHAQPTIAWSREDGAPLPSGRHSLAGGNLTIADVAAEDRGVYVCTAANEAAAVAARTELLVENVPPRAPHALQAHPHPRRIHLAWQPGRSGGGGGVEVEYTVWYRERADPEWRTMKILSRGVTEATLPGLRPAAEYELRVLAQDHIGDGLFSRPLLVRTLDAEGGDPGETAYAAATTEPTEGSDEEGDGGDDGGEGALEVSARLVDEGALVRWRRGPADDSRCTLRWYEGEGGGGGAQGRPLAVVHTRLDYVLVREVAEGARYEARVSCASGARGSAAVRVPAWARLRGVAAGAAAAALLLAALAGVLLAARRRRRRAQPRPAPPARARKR